MYSTGNTFQMLLLKLTEYYEINESSSMIESLESFF